MAPRLGDCVAWHPSCFSCGTCSELLVDLVYCVWEDGVHCGRHYAEKLKPRCSACDEVRLGGVVVKWEGRMEEGAVCVMVRCGGCDGLVVWCVVVVSMC